MPIPFLLIIYNNVNILPPISQLKLTLLLLILLSPKAETSFRDSSFPS